MKYLTPYEQFCKQWREIADPYIPVTTLDKKIAKEKQEKEIQMQKMIDDSYLGNSHEDNDKL